MKNDPLTYTLGAQHDARLLPDGTLTVFDNRTKLGNQPPRAVRYRINQKRGTATLLRSITDPDVRTPTAAARPGACRIGDWLIAWGKHEPIGGYQADGKRTFLLTFPPTSAIARSRSRRTRSRRRICAPA